MLDQSLEQIENDYWGEPTYPSHLVKTCHKIRTIPLKDLTAEHLRMAIGQKISLPILMPLAIQILLNDPLIDAHFFNGDLLQNVLRCDEYFSSNKTSRTELCGICQKALTLLDNEDFSDAPPEILIQINAFINTEVFDS